MHVHPAVGTISADANFCANPLIGPLHHCHLAHPLQSWHQTSHSITTKNRTQAQSAHNAECVNLTCSLFPQSLSPEQGNADTVFTTKINDNQSGSPLKLFCPSDHFQRNLVSTEAPIKAVLRPRDQAFSLILTVCPPHDSVPIAWRHSRVPNLLFRLHRAGVRQLAPRTGTPPRHGRLQQVRTTPYVATLMRREYRPSQGPRPIYCRSPDVKPNDIQTLCVSATLALPNGH